MKSLSFWIRNNKTKFKIWCALIFMSLIGTMIQTGKNKKPGDLLLVEKQSIDTFIPEGFVLMPVELINSSSLYGILEGKGVVDLYSASPENSKAEKVASAVKILRTPMDPKNFAILVPEHNAKFLIQMQKAFYAVIQNPKKTGTKINSLNKKPYPRHIVIEKSMLEKDYL